jgi:predicted HicB family RNase H-like nuclease
MSQAIRYKGYGGSVELSAEDHVLHGSLLGIRDAVAYEGADADSLEANFRVAVDEYLAFCTAQGKTPDRPLGSVPTEDAIFSEIPRRGAMVGSTIAETARGH